MVANDGDNTGVGVVTLGEQLRRRRAAAAASRPLRCGHRDPLTCLARRCHESRRARDDLHPPPSDRWVDAGAAAAAHLLAAGVAPILDVDTLRGMWRHGHHRLAQHCYDLAGGG
ncbi:MAG TPA: hypothetical protein VMS84_14280 [Mycobacterium sp.]|jgi:hypothetical protein|nr:hypothetical protein [Mycobacterium sp.]